MYADFRVKILNNRIRATTILCSPSLIRSITPKLGRFLGPLGLMPSERRGTVTEDIAGYIQRLQGTMEWRADRAGNIRAPIAKVRSKSLIPSCAINFICRCTFQPRTF